MVLNRLHQNRHQALLAKNKMLFHAPPMKIDRLNSLLDNLKANLLFNYRNIVNHYRHRQKELISRLSALDPESILSRGYSITRTLPHKKIIKNSGQIKIGQKLEIQFAKGQAWVDVVKKQ